MQLMLKDGWESNSQTSWKHLNILKSCWSQMSCCEHLWVPKHNNTKPNNLLKACHRPCHRTCRPAIFGRQVLVPSFELSWPCSLCCNWGCSEALECLVAHDDAHWSLWHDNLRCTRCSIHFARGETKWPYPLRRHRHGHQRLCSLGMSPCPLDGLWLSDQCQRCTGNIWTECRSDHAVTTLWSGWKQPPRPKLGPQTASHPANRQWDSLGSGSGLPHLKIQKEFLSSAILHGLNRLYN